MKSIFILLPLNLFFLASSAQTKQPNTMQVDSTKKILVVKTACGQCKLGLPGKSCDLAVRINGKSYFVDGTDIDSHGDAHAEDGFCNSVRKAEVQGEIIDDRYKVTYFKLVKNKPKK